MAQSSRPLSSVEDLDVVVDADGHTLESIDDLLRYVDNEAIRRRIENCEMPYADVYTYTHVGPIIGEAYGRGGKVTTNDVQEDIQKRRDLEDFGIDYSITTPTLNLMIHTVNNDRYAVALARAYNDWVADRLLDQSSQFKSTLVVPPRRPAAAAEEIDRRGGDDQVVGVYLPPGAVMALGDEFYDPVYEAASRHDLTVICHGLQMREAGFPRQAEGAQTFGESHVLSLPWSVMWGMNSIMFQGVPERFPDLEFVFQEAGIGWVPWMRWRMDDHYLEFTDDFPHLEQLPSKYIDEQFYFTTQPVGHTADEPKHVARAIEMAGVENVMYSADLPHMDFDPPGELFDRINPFLDEGDVRAIMGETAVDVFGLDR